MVVEVDTICATRVRAKETNMQCKECQESGRTSRVYPGLSTRTMMGWQPYYDEAGVLHNEDPNKTTTHYSCSNGHKWTETS
jgi:hypothetical protein